MADTIFETLQEGSFDGIVVPVQAIRLATGSAKAFHSYPFRAGVDIEYTGREAVSGQITAVYVNGLEDVGGTNDLWPGAVELLRNRVQEQKSGPLVIPTLGKLPFAAVYIDESYTFDFVDGTIVTLKFVEDSGDQFAGLTITSGKSKLGSSGTFADAALVAKGLPLPDTTADDGTRITSFASWVNNIIGQFDQFQDDIARPVRQLARMVQAVDNLLDTVEAIGNVTDWPLAYALRDLKAASVDTANEITRAQDLTTYTTKVPTNIATIARMTGNTVADVLNLNAVFDGNNIDAGETFLVFANTLGAVSRVGRNVRE